MSTTPPIPQGPASEPPTGHAIPGAGQSDVSAGSRIAVAEFPRDLGLRTHRRVTTRAADRRGHGARGPILPPEVPRWKSRSEEFDTAALEAFALIDQDWHSSLTNLDLAVDMVPRMRLRPGESWPEEVVADGAVPLARLVPAGVDRLGRPTRAKLVLFRRPLTLRAGEPDELKDVIHEILVALVSLYLEISPGDLEKGPDA